MDKHQLQIHTRLQFLYAERERERESYCQLSFRRLNQPTESDTLDWHELLLFSPLAVSILRSNQKVQNKGRDKKNCEPYKMQNWTRANCLTAILCKLSLCGHINHKYKVRHSQKWCLIYAHYSLDNRYYCTLPRFHDKAS